MYMYPNCKMLFTGLNINLHIYLKLILLVLKISIAIRVLNAYVLDECFKKSLYVNYRWPFVYVEGRVNMYQLSI